MNIWEQKNREMWASMPDHMKTTERLQSLIIMHKQSPHLFNSPADQYQYQFACEDLTARGKAIPTAERVDTTDFKYRLERYGY